MFLKLNLFVISYDAKVKWPMYLLCYQQVIFRLILKRLTVPAIIIFPKMKRTIIIEKCICIYSARYNDAISTED